MGTSAEKLLKILRICKNVVKVVRKITEDCEGCRENAKTKPRPKASMSRVDKFDFKGTEGGKRLRGSS